MLPIFVQLQRCSSLAVFRSFWSSTLNGSAPGIGVCHACRTTSPKSANLVQNDSNLNRLFPPCTVSRCSNNGQWSEQSEESGFRAWLGNAANQSLHAKTLSSSSNVGLSRSLLRRIAFPTTVSLRVAVSGGSCGTASCYDDLGDRCFCPGPDRSC